MTLRGATAHQPHPDALHEAAVPPTRSRSARRGRWLVYWDPEDTGFWEQAGARTARRNLIASVLVENICYAVWTMWSALVLFLGPAYGLSPAEKFTLVSLPAAVGGAVRIPYTLAVTRWGGRNWTIASASVLLVPAIATAFLLKPGVEYSTLLILAALGGIGGGSFASSTSNINGFYPERLKGFALGMNAAGGNLGVAVVQLVSLAVLATAGASHPRYVLALYIPLLVVAALIAARYMDNLPARRSARRAMREGCRLPHAWVMSLLYVGTFGSFIGFGFAFGQVLLVEFPEQFDTPIKAAYLTFLGPLIGALARPIGGRMADRLGGAVVTFWNFAAMAIAALMVLIAANRNSLPLYLVGFIALFVTAGLGNGSTYKMIPAIFRGKADVEIANGASRTAANNRARRRTTAVIGIAGTVGAFGGVGVNLAFRESFRHAGNGTAAFAIFTAVYLLCGALTWVVYLRPRTAPDPGLALVAPTRPAPEFIRYLTGAGHRHLGHCSCAGKRICATCR